jgi:PST family polysaccharide transporter
MMGRPDLGHVLGWMGLALVANGAGTVPLALLRRDLGYRAIAIRSLTGKVLGAAIAICMVLLGFGLWSLVAQHLVATAASALWLLATMAERPRLRLSRARLAELLRVGAPVCATALMAAGLFRVYTVALGVLFGPVPAGLFNMASRLVDTTSGLVNKTAFQISLALLSARQHDPLAVRHALGRATEASCFLALPVYAGLAACAGDLVPALLGPAWAPAIPLIQILALSAMASTALLLYTAAYNAMGRPELGAFGLAAEWAGAFGALALLGQGEVTGAALAWLCRHLLLVPVSVLVMRRALGSGLVEQLGGAARAMVACAAMAGCIHLVREHALAGWSPLETLLVTVPTGVLAYAAASLLVQRRTAAAIVGELTGRPRHSPAGAD